MTRADWIRGCTFSAPARKPEDFPAETLVDVKTTGTGGSELAFIARAVSPSSETHLRVRTDDGYVFAVPAADCVPLGEPR